MNFYVNTLQPWHRIAQYYRLLFQHYRFSNSICYASLITVSHTHTHTQGARHSLVKAYLMNNLFMFSIRCSAIWAWSSARASPACFASRQTTDWRAALSSCHCPASSQRPDTPAPTPWHSGWFCAMPGSGWFCCCWLRQLFFMICFEYVCEGNRKADGTKKLQHKCSAKWRRHRKRHTHSDTL